MSKRKSYSSTSNFILKLYDMLEKQEYSHCIAWKSNSNHIEIKNIPLMELIVLDKYFNHSNFTSFIRQLNMYDFHKVGNVEKNQLMVCFEHQLFRPGRKDLLSQIKRKKKCISLNKQQNVAESPPAVPINIQNLKDLTSKLKYLIDGVVNYVPQSIYQQFDKVISNMNNILQFQHTLNADNVKIEEQSLQQAEVRKKHSITNLTNFTITTLPRFDTRCSIQCLIEPKVQPA